MDYRTTPMVIDLATPLDLTTPKWLSDDKTISQIIGGASANPISHIWGIKQFPFIFGWRKQTPLLGSEPPYLN